MVKLSPIILNLTFLKNINSLKNNQHKLEIVIDGFATILLKFIVMGQAKFFINARHKIHLINNSGSNINLRVVLFIICALLFVSKINAQKIASKKLFTGENIEWSDFKGEVNLSLIDELKLILKKSNEKTFVVIHTLGSHWNYSARYPNEFDFFKPSYKTVNAKPNDILFKNVLVNSYDNSVRYTDAIIDSVISLVNSYKGFSSVTFMSDHGVDLMDDDRKLVYRNPIPSKNVAHIPFFIWYSPQFEQIFPNHISVLKANSGRKISSENLLYTLSGMLGIKIENQNVEKDVSNSNFVDTKQLILGNSKVYNIDSLK